MASANIKVQLLEALEDLLEEALMQVLDYARSLQTSSEASSTTLASSMSTEDDEIWQAYLASVNEREEVYRRLADS